MPRARALPVVALTALLALITLTLSAAQPAGSSTPTASTPTASTPTASTPRRTVTLALSLPPAGVVPPPATGAARRQQLALLAPQAAPREEVRAAVQRLGLVITSDDGLTLTTSGPADRVDELFGPRPPRAGDGLRVPAALADTVAAALDSDDRRPLVRRHAGAPGSTGTTYATAYSVPATAVALSPPPTFTATTPIVATVQFSGWDDTALSSYAAARLPGLSDPRGGSTPQYVGIGVGRSTTWTPDDGEGYLEVALDQEATLGAAPRLRQRAYIGPNTGAGIVATYRRVLADVTAGAPIAALSTSWGGCEAQAPATFRGQLDDVFASLLAAGVTVFAASGDGGRYDCQSSTTTRAYASVPAVDYPASSPQVLGVGGTRHPGGSAAPAPDTLWDGPVSGPDPDGSVDASGSGGGVSTVYPVPDHQRSIGLSGGRQVPDLALQGDPATGMPLVLTDQAHGGTTPRDTYPQVYAGTSLSAPLAAAMLADVTGAHGCAAGIGDLHAVLYAASVSGGVSDVVAYSSPGAASHGARAPGVGYDTGSGLGTPAWATLATRIFTGSGCALRPPRLAVVADPALVGVLGAIASGLPSGGSSGVALSVRPVGAGGLVTGPAECTLPVPDSAAAALSALRGSTYAAGGATAGPLTPPCLLGAVTTGQPPG